MPVSIKSRYHGLPVNDVDVGDNTHATIAIRPASDAQQGNREHQLTGGESLEFLAWRFYGSSDAWWRISDAMEIRYPLDMQSGDFVNIPSARSNRPLQRTRKF